MMKRGWRKRRKLSKIIEGKGEEVEEEGKEATGLLPFSVFHKFYLLLYLRHNW